MNETLRGFKSTTDEIIFSCSAPINQEETLQILHSIGSTFTAFNVDPVVSSKLFYVSLEMLQNQVKHGEALPAESLKFNPAFAITHAAGNFCVCSTNYLLTEHVSNLVGRLRQLNELASNERRTRFREILKQPIATGSESTGLGLLDVARRCNTKFNYRFYKFTSQYSFLYLCITLHLDNKAKSP